jgi:hypothetical protein
MKFNPMKEESAMKTSERPAPWTTRLGQGLEMTLFVAATLVVSSGIFVMLLRPDMVLA